MAFPHDIDPPGTRRHWHPDDFWGIGTETSNRMGYVDLLEDESVLAKSIFRNPRFFANPIIDARWRTGAPQSVTKVTMAIYAQGLVDVIINDYGAGWIEALAISGIPTSFNDLVPTPPGHDSFRLRTFDDLDILTAVLRGQTCR